MFKIEGALRPALDQAAQVDSQPPLQESIPRRRRHRVTHGEVTIIRPVASDLSETERLSELDGPAEGHGALPHFGVEPQEQRRYATLMAEIARLKLQAQAAKRTEAAAAVRWIRKAIAEFEIGAADLGFR